MFLIVVVLFKTYSDFSRPLFFSFHRPFPTILWRLDSALSRENSNPAPLCLHFTFSPTFPLRKKASSCDPPFTFLSVVATCAPLCFRFLLSSCALVLRKILFPPTLLHELSWNFVYCVDSHTRRLRTPGPRGHPLILQYLLGIFSPVRHISLPCYVFVNSNRLSPELPLPLRKSIILPVWSFLSAIKSLQIL